MNIPEHLYMANTHLKKKTDFFGVLHVVLCRLNRTQHK